MQCPSAEIPFLVRRGVAAPHQKRNMGGGRRPPPPHGDAVSVVDEWHDHAEGSRRNGIDPFLTYRVVTVRVGPTPSGCARQGMQPHPLTTSTPLPALCSSKDTGMIILPDTWQIETSGLARTIPICNMQPASPIAGLSQTLTLYSPSGNISLL